MIEAELGLLEVQVEHMPLNTLHLGQAQFGIGPERFDAVDVGQIVGELIAGMVHPQVLGVPNVHQSVIAAPAIAVDDAIERHLATDHLLQRGFAGIGHDFGDNPAIAFEQAEDDGLAPCATPALTAYTAWAKVGFVHFDLASQVAVPFARFGQTPAQLDVDVVDGA